jgi:DNA-binding FrmR family transcriptional regulator
MKSYKQRFNNIQGQIEGIEHMVETGEDPYKVLIQLKAARSGINSVMRMYLEENFNRFLNECADKEKACKQLFDELIQ